MTLKLCERCFTMKKIRGKKIICKRCEEELEEKMKNSHVETKGQVLRKSSRNNNSL